MIKEKSCPTGPKMNSASVPWLGLLTPTHRLAPGQLPRAPSPWGSGYL